MKLQLILLLACVSAVYCSTIKDVISRKSTVLNNSRKLGIYDGKNTTIKDHPYLGAVSWVNFFLCAVTIVSSQWVVTNGDCVYGWEDYKLEIMVASDDLKAGIKFKVDKVVIHPEFFKVNFDYNFACIKIKGTFEWSDKVKAVALPKEAAKPGTEMVAAGWGFTKRGNRLEKARMDFLDELAVKEDNEEEIKKLESEVHVKDAVNAHEESNYILQQGNMKWLAKKKCEATYKPFGVSWTDRMACAYNKGKTTMCDEDWGDAFINRGVFYGMYQAGEFPGWCTSKAIPVMIANIQPVADWVKTITGAKFEDESLF